MNASNRGRGEEGVDRFCRGSTRDRREYLPEKETKGVFSVPEKSATPIRVRTPFPSIPRPQRFPCRKAEMPYEIVDPRSLSPIVPYNRIFIRSRDREGTRNDRRAPRDRAILYETRL